MRTRASVASRQGSRGGNDASLRDLVQQARQKHLKLWQDDLNELRSFAARFRGRGAEPNVYDVEAVTGEDTGGQPAEYRIDQASLRTVLSGTTYTISGVVTGTSGTEARVRVFAADSSGNKLFDNGSEVLVYGALPLVDLGSGSNTFSMVFDSSQIPGNVTQPLGPANPWVITASDPAANDESHPVLVPLPNAAPTTATFSIDAGSVFATQSGTLLTITGTAREPGNTPAVARVWVGLPNGSKAPGPKLQEQWVASGSAVALAGGVGTFSVTIDLAALPSGIPAPTTANPYVVTLCDTAVNNEMPLGVVVPPPGTTPTTSPVPAPTITDPVAPVGVTATTYSVKGTIPASASRMLVQAWPASGAAKAGTAPAAAFVVDPGFTSFTLPTTLPSSGANQLVVTATDLTTMQESPLVFLPTITTSSTVVVTPPPPPVTPPPATPPTPAPVAAAPSVGTENIESVQGIGATIAPKLRAAGVHTTGDLLNTAGTRAGRTKLAKTLGKGFNASTVLEWVNRADLARVVGIGPEYSDLLEAAGVDTVRELARRKPADLRATLESVNSGHKPQPYVRQLPNESQVASWIAAAKALPAMVKF